MAVDSTFNETESSPEENRDDAVAAQRTPGPPRPPRPVKRNGSGRIPMPAPSSHPDFGRSDSDAGDAAPGVDIEDERDAAFPLVSPRGRSVSPVPEESFADVDAELHDHAPPAPVTPRRGMPRVELDTGEETPARAAPAALAYDREDPEPTIVGKVPMNLLELSSAGEENTRAFTAPRELIELARRRREERLDSNMPSDAHLRDTQRPARAALEDADADAAPPRPVDSAPVRRGDEDRAMPSSRGYSVDLGAAAAAPDSDSVPGRHSSPVIEVEPGSAESLSLAPAQRAPVAPPSEPLPSRVGSNTSLKPALFVAALFVLVGVVIARWHEILQLLQR
ncbi:MAG TPA: hypothetical protein VNN80_36460 [Polyangiaceae bacterium]|nr:hypothetical protein [Polyangiaceae bacterium]